MNPKFIYLEINKLLLRGITQTRIVRKELAGFLAFIGSNPYSCIRQPNFFYFHVYLLPYLLLLKNMFQCLAIVSTFSSIIASIIFNSVGLKP